MDLVQVVTTLLIGLMGFVQIIFMFVLGRIFNNQDKLFSVIESLRLEHKDDLNTMKSESKELLENHYVTTGQLNTLEEKLVGQISRLSLSIEHLTKAINSSFENLNFKERE